MGPQFFLQEVARGGYLKTRKRNLMDRKHLLARGPTEKLQISGTGRKLSCFDVKSVEEIASGMKPGADGSRTLPEEVVVSEVFLRR